jgi:hypothetical protein
MLDRFASSAETRGDFGSRHVAITPDDDADLTELPKAVYCQAAGTIIVRDSAGIDLPYDMTAGQCLPIRPVRVLETGTSGTYYAIY